MTPFTLTGQALRANAARWAALHLSAPVDWDQPPGVRLVHRAPTPAIEAIVQAEVIRSAQALRRADPGHPTRSFPMDGQLDLDGAVFFTPGFVTQDASHAGGAAIVLSAEASARVLAAPRTRWVAQDLADVLRLFRCRAPDVLERRSRFEEAVALYLDHVFTGIDGAALQRAVIEQDHGSDEEAWRGWIARCHAGRGFDHASEEVESCWRRTGSLPMTPEVIVPGWFELADDPDYVVIAAEDGVFRLPP